VEFELVSIHLFLKCSSRILNSFDLKNSLQRVSQSSPLYIFLDSADASAECVFVGWVRKSDTVRSLISVSLSSPDRANRWERTSPTPVLDLALALAGVVSRRCLL
jgi:hypothetical protein